MNQLKAISLSFLCILYFSFAGAQKISFGRGFINARHSQKELELLIAQDSSIDAAFGKIKSFFVPERGEKFILIGKKCIEGAYRTRYYNVFPSAPIKTTSRQLLVTRAKEKVEKRLTRYIGTIFLFGDYNLQLFDVTDIYEISNIYYQYSLDGVEKSIKLNFDPINETLLIAKSIYPPDVEYEKIADTKIKIEYRHGQRDVYIKNVKVVFANPEEELALREMLNDCGMFSLKTSETDAMCIEQMLDDLKQGGALAFPDNVSQWLKAKQ